MISIAKMGKCDPFETIPLLRFDGVRWYVLGEPTTDPYLILGMLLGGRVTGQA